MTSSSASAPILAGIFVGGKGERLGGAAKGLLRTSSGETLLDRWRRRFDELAVPVVLVGEHPAYAAVDLPVVGDADDGGEAMGPLGGLVALLEAAIAVAPDAYALAVACDMPFVERALLSRLIAAPPADALAPMRGGRWEPFLARYRAATLLPIARERARARRTSLQGLFTAVCAEVLALDESELRQLDDWDRPEDVAARPA